MYVYIIKNIIIVFYLFLYHIIVEEVQYICAHRAYIIYICLLLCTYKYIYVCNAKVYTNFRLLLFLFYILRIRQLLRVVKVRNVWLQDAGYRGFRFLLKHTRTLTYLAWTLRQMFGSFIRMGVCGCVYVFYENIKNISFNNASEYQKTSQQTFEGEFIFFTWKKFTLYIYIFFQFLFNNLY